MFREPAFGAFSVCVDEKTPLNFKLSVSIIMLQLKINRKQRERAQICIRNNNAILSLNGSRSELNACAASVDEMSISLCSFPFPAPSCLSNDASVFKVFVIDMH